MAGVTRELRVAPAKKAALGMAELRAGVATLGQSSLIGKRDAALLLVGFAGAFRRAELVAIDAADCEFVGEGVRLTVRRSKTDQDGAGRVVGVPYAPDATICPVLALRRWIEAAAITDGAVFLRVDRHGKPRGRLTGQSVALIVKRAIEAAGLDASRYAGHSLRAGLITSAAAAGVDERAIMAQSRHKSVEVMRGCIRDASVFRNNEAAAVMR
jgi:integrase